MISEAQYVKAIKQAKESDKEHKFTHAIEMIAVFRDIDVKKGFALNEVVQLPNKMNKPAQVCIIASGDMGAKAKKTNAMMVTLFPPILSAIAPNIGANIPHISICIPIAKPN